MRNLSIKWKSYLACAVLLALIVLMGIFITNQIHDILWERTSDYTVRMIEKICYDIDIMLGELDWQTGQLVFDDDVRTLVQGDASSSLANRVQDKIDNTLGDLPSYVAGGDILIISKDMRILASTSAEWIGKYRILGVEWTNKVMQAKGSSVRVTGYSVSKGDSLRNLKVMNVARGIFVDDQYVGMLVLDIPIQSIESVCAGANIGTNGFISIIDEDNYVIFSTNPLDMGNQFNRISPQSGPQDSPFVGVIGGEDMFFIQTKSDYSGIVVVGALPLKEVFLPATRLIRNVFWAILVFGVSILLVTFWVVVSISRPTLQLAQTMKQAELGDLAVRVKDHRSDEIGILQKGFNNMLDQVQDLIDREYMANLREREAQLNELTAIINPHFIYNTLEAINMKAYLNNDLQVVGMLNGLARLFRIMTNNTLRYITIDEELNHCATYLELMKYKDDPSIVFSFAVAPGMGNCYTLKFLLQPLVENSIIHGFCDKSQGTIAVSVQKDGDTVVMSVEDDGEGVSPAVIAQLRNTLAHKGADSGKPSALRNIQDRIQLAFGKTYGLSVFLNSQGGTTVVLRIPLLSEPLEIPS